MKLFMVYGGLLIGAIEIAMWQESVYLGIGIVLLFQVYLIANDLPKP